MSLTVAGTTTPFVSTRRSDAESRGEGSRRHVMKPTPPSVLGPRKAEKRNTAAERWPKDGRVALRYTVGCILSPQPAATALLKQVLLHVYFISKRCLSNCLAKHSGRGKRFEPCTASTCRNYREIVADQTKKGQARPPLRSNSIVAV